MGSSRVEQPDNLRKGVQFESHPTVHLLRRWAFAFGEKPGADICGYYRRWFLETPIGSIRLHKWTNSDDPRAEHDHAWNALVILLSGSYEEAGRIHKAPTFYLMKAEHKHRVQLLSKTVWSLVLTGPVRRRWGFFVKNKWIRARRYFFKYGHHKC